jgi:2-methylisocitrate lyase-like PEP mutase family enzyme
VTTQLEKGEVFRELHATEPFVIPNPWDAGSARVLEGLGFRALATTSSGFAYTLGRGDGGATLDDVATHVGVLSKSTTLPVSVDLEAGYDDPAAAVLRVAEAGAVGGSIEDYNGERLLPLDEAVPRIEAAAAAARALAFPFMLTARAENHIRGNPDLDDTIARLRAYEEAGADVLYAPGIRGDEIRTVCEAVSKPVNVLAFPGMRFVELAAAGARRVSVGGGLAWVAADALIRAATALRDDGDFSVLSVEHSPREYLR